MHKVSFSSAVMDGGSQLLLAVPAEVKDDAEWRKMTTNKASEERRFPQRTGKRAGTRPLGKCLKHCKVSGHFLLRWRQRCYIKNQLKDAVSEVMVTTFRKEAARKTPARVGGAYPLAASRGRWSCYGNNHVTRLRENRFITFSSLSH